MEKKKLVRLGLKLAIAGFVIAIVVALYLFNMPARDVQGAKVDYSVTATKLVNEYLENNQTANAKYLAEDGESKILEIKGVVKEITTNFNNETVVVLNGPQGKANVNCTFLPESNENIKVGKEISIKGVIQSGASYDDDLEMYTDVVIGKVSLVK